MVSRNKTYNGSVGIYSNYFSQSKNKTSESPSTYTQNNNTLMENTEYVCADEPMEECYNPTDSPVIFPISQNVLTCPGVSGLGNKVEFPKNPPNQSTLIRIPYIKKTRNKDIRRISRKLYLEQKKWKKYAIKSNLSRGNVMVKYKNYATIETDRMLEMQHYYEKSLSSVAHSTNPPSSFTIREGSGMSLALSLNNIPSSIEDDSVNELTKAMEKL